MKRELKDSEAASAPEDWSAGAAALLDSYDDVMWDELCDLSPPQSPRMASVETRVTPVDAISGASPTKRPNACVQTLEQYSGGAGSPIHGDLGSLTPLAGGGASFQVAKVMQTWAAIQPAVAKPDSFEQEVEPPSWPVSPAPSSCASSASETFSETTQPQSAAEMRRQKNREWMRRSRQKQREAISNMKVTVGRLERQYAALSLQSSANALTVSSHGGALAPQSRLASDYAQAMELSRRLGAENLYLKAEIQQQAAWKLNLSRVLQSRLEVDGPRWAQQFQQPALGGEQVLRMQLDELDEFAAAEEFGFHPLTDLDLTGAILENSRTIARVQSRLLVPSSSDTDDGAWTRRMQTFGWDMVQRVHGNVMECVFTKTFRGLNVAQLMQKTWANDMRLGEFKKVKGETSRLEVLQQVNPNAYVLCRDVMSPTDDISTFRSVFVRFLIETSEKIPASQSESASTCIDASAPTTPPQYADSESDCDEVLLSATGYVLGTQSFDTDYSRSPRAEDVRDKVAWAHLSLSIEFLNVVNPVTGDEYQQLRWSGRTDYCGREHAMRNASDMMQGLLRWEMVVIAPAVNLMCLPLE
jgi:hypothetical protein